MELFIHKDFFSSPFHLHYRNGKLEKTNSIPELSLGTKEFETFSKLYDLELPSFPPRNYLKAYRGLLKGWGAQSVPWSFCLPTEAYIDSIKDISEQIYYKVENLDITYYEQFFKKSNLILESLQPAKIDKDIFEMYREDPIVKTFDFNEDGYADLPVYSRVDTVTGRLKVLSGPNSLNLRRDYRNIITSRFGNSGKIFYLDFKSIEPRLALAVNLLGYSNKGCQCGTLPIREREGAINNTKNIPKDIYGEIGSIINDRIKISREDVKAVVISEMYGAGISSLKEQIPHLSENEILFFTGIVRSFLGTQALKEKLIIEYEINDKKFIKNLYSRHVSTIEIASYALINRFIQSSAVDVALFGFSNIISYIKEMNWEAGIVPISVIHDALVLDIHKDHFESLPTLCKVGSIDIPLLEQFSFYLKAEKLQC